MINTIARDGGDLQGLLRPVRKAQDAYVQRVPERVRHVNAAAGGRPGELFHEVRDALAAFVNKIDDHIAGRPLHQLGQQLSDLGAIKAGYVDTYRAGEAANLGEEGPQRMAAGQLIGAVGRNDHHRRVGQSARQEAEQMASGLISPVNVLDDHHQRAIFTGPLQQHRDGLEKLQPDGVIGLARRRAQVGQQRTKGPSPNAGPFEDLLAAVLSHQIPQGADNWRVRQPLTTHRHALSADQLSLAIGQWAEQFSHKRFNDGRLAGACVAANDHKSAAVVDDIVQRAAELGTLLRTPDNLVGAYGGGRSRRSNHKHYRATWF